VTSWLNVTEPERVRAAEVEALERTGDVPALAARLSDSSWLVRRAVCAALARLGDSAVSALCEVLRNQRDDERRIAAAVDALVISQAAVDDAILALADSSDAAVVCDAAQILGRRRSERAMPKLAELATGRDDNVALAAFEAVGRIGGEGAIGLLIAAVESGSFFRTFPAIDVLGRTGDPRAVAPLCKLLNHPHYANEAARALGRTGQPHAVPHLVALMLKPNDGQVRVAAAALAEIYDRSAERFGANRAVEDALGAFDASAVSRRLTQALVGADAVERTTICRVLGWVGGESAAGGLVAMLDAEPAAATAAATAIAGLAAAARPSLLAALRQSDSERRLLLLPILARSESAALEILECLADAHPGVRAVACDTLGKIGDLAAIPALFGRLADEDGRVSQAAVSAIQALGGTEAERLALEAARSPDARVRRSGLRVLSYFGWVSALEVFLEAMNDPDERLRDIAALGLASMDDGRAMASLLVAASHASPRTRSAAVRGLGRMTSAPAVVEALKQALTDEDAWVRYYACQSLSRVKDDGSVEAIRALLGDPAGHVRVAAIEALARLRGARALEALHAAASASDPDLQRAALLAIGTVRDAASIPVVRGALASPDGATRLVALSALAEFGERVALTGMRDAMSDTEESVRNAAISLLASLRGVEATQTLLAVVDNPVLHERALAALATPVEGRVEGLVVAMRTASRELVPHIVSALARMRRADSSAALEDAFHDDRASTRKAVAPALAALGMPSARRLLEAAAATDDDAQVRSVCAALLTD
jgi:HEAT repeat protein